jgi:hypothetical protein
MLVPYRAKIIRKQARAQVSSLSCAKSGGGGGIVSPLVQLLARGNHLCAIGAVNDRTRPAIDAEFAYFSDEPVGRRDQDDRDDPIPLVWGRTRAGDAASIERRIVEQAVFDGDELGPVRIDHLTGYGLGGMAIRLRISGAPYRTCAT